MDATAMEEDLTLSSGDEIGDIDITDILQDLQDVLVSTDKAGTSNSSKDKAFPLPMEVDDLELPDEELLNKLCREASKSFFRYDPSKKGGESGWRRAKLKFGRVTTEQPMFWACGDKGGDETKFLKLLPRHARLQRMTYSSRIKVEIEYQVYTLGKRSSDKFKTGKETQINKDIITEGKQDVFIGRIPVMVKSNLCWMNGRSKSDCDFDHGGYFIIKGAEKTFVAQEQICLKRLWISKEPNLQISYRTESRRIRLDIRVDDIPPKCTHLQGTKVLNVRFLSCIIPLWVFLFALGMSSDKEIIEMIDIDMSNANSVNLLLSTIGYADTDDEFEDFRKGGNSLKIFEKMISELKFPPNESTMECLENYLLPRLSSFKQKAMFIGYMVKCLLQSYSGERKFDNRDDFRNKRLDLAAELLERELRNHIKHAERRMVKCLQRDLYGNRELHPIDYYFDASIITNGLTRAFSTGGWSHHLNRGEKIPGVVANLRRANPLQMISDLRKTRQQVKYAGKVGDARFPHPSHWGKLCFLSTSDGENCGLVKNIAVTGLVSTNLIGPSLSKLLECGMVKLVNNPSPMTLKGKDKIFLNGEWVGVCEDSLSFVCALRSMRRSKKIPHEVEIKRDQQQKEVRIFSDSGRIMRPLLVVENLNKLKVWKGDYNIKSLLDEGIIELIGIEEEEDILTAWSVKYLVWRDKEYTHCELDPSFLLGLSCGIIPFPNHNHARRVLYQSEKHSQQAIGFSTTNPNIRVDTLSHQLYYPQRPLFQTMISDSLGKPEYAQGKYVRPKPEIYNGQNAIVAINIHQGYNQEDSLVMNRASVERGMFRTEHVRCYKADVENNELLETKRLKAKDRIDFGKMQSKIGRVDTLDDDGFPYIGANLQSGDIVIGRGAAESGSDHSIKLKHTERGYVQKVILSANDEGKNFASVSLRQVRAPTVGDKFSSMHGQKGVIGLLESQENFPFTRQGIVPDIVINPHAFPTRQTTGQLLEAALGKGIATGGLTRYATPFTTPSIDVITEQLHRAGFSRWGQERVCNGRDGKMMSAMLFIGPTFYQRLIHMAEDKVKFRNTGPVHPLTRQPVQDRKRFGGVKFGEMERDCLLAHGAAANLYERLFTLSDLSQMHVCSKCANIATVILRPVPGGGKIRGPHCRFCQSAEDIVKVNVPYGAKLLCQELFSMGISVKFGTEPC